MATQVESISIETSFRWKPSAPRDNRIVQGLWNCTVPMSAFYCVIYIEQKLAKTSTHLQGAGIICDSGHASWKERTSTGQGTMSPWDHNLPLLAPEEAHDVCSVAFKGFPADLTSTASWKATLGSLLYSYYCRPCGPCPRPRGRPRTTESFRLLCRLVAVRLWGGNLPSLNLSFVRGKVASRLLQFSIMGFQE
jgi:hypothetical protein